VVSGLSFGLSAAVAATSRRVLIVPHARINPVDRDIAGNIGAQGWQRRISKHLLLSGLQWTKAKWAIKALAASGQVRQRSGFLGHVQQRRTADCSLSNFLNATSF